MRAIRNNHLLFGWAAHCVLFAAVWVVLTAAAIDAVGFGVLAIVVAAAVSAKVRSSQSLNLLGLVKFIPFYLKRCFWGAVDVSYQALKPNLSLKPVLVQYHLSLPYALQRVMLMHTLTLSPGTLSADMRDDVLVVHALNGEGDNLRDIQELENWVLQLFKGEDT